MRSSLAPGTLAKLLFGFGDDGSPSTERMWVEILDVRAGRCAGRLENEPQAISDLRLGDRVAFGPEHVAAVVRDTGHAPRDEQFAIVRERIWGDVRVPPKLMAGSRRSGREPGKSDPIDALATARAASREPDLPMARLDGIERDVRLLVDRREELVQQRTAEQNRLRWHLHELAPGEEPAARTLDRRRVLAGLEARLAGLDGTVAAIAADLVARIRELTIAIDRLEHEIEALVERLAPTLLALTGATHGRGLLLRTSEVRFGAYAVLTFPATSGRHPSPPTHAMPVCATRYRRAHAEP